VNAADTIAAKLARGYSGAVYDVLRQLGVLNCALPPAIQGLAQSCKIAGPVFTLSGARGNFGAHETLLRWTEFLAKAPAGCVVACQPNDDGLAHMGELSAEALKLRGVRGYVVDGGTRDSERILQSGFAVFCKYRTPADIVGRWAPVAYQEPIVIGTVTIRAGDFILGDIDGVIVIPAGIAAEVAERVEQIANTESQLRQAILSGMDPQKAYLEFGLF
jgi:4-hydroxy-4-methyl-2-oxoglutarate aldolase